MFSAFLYLFVALTIWSDFRIYKTLVKDKGRFWRVFWKVQSVVSVAPFLVLFIGGFFVDLRWTPWIIFSLWYIGFFLIQFILKIFPALAIQIGKKWCMPLAAVLSVLLVAVNIYGITVCRCQIDVRNVEICSNEVPEQFDEFRIALVSDIHLGTMSLDDRLLERTVDSINALHPDIVIQCGDIINIDVNELTPERIETLSAIEAPVYSVLGNHDQGFYFKDTVEIDPRKMVDSLRIIECDVLGWTLLENSHVYIHRGDDSLAIAGVTYANNFGNYKNSVCGISDLSSALEGISERDFTILLSHTPAMTDSLQQKGRGVDLMLSGHTHSMQMRFAGISPTFFLYKYPWGLYDVDGTCLYVNGGIGTVGYPFRIGALPEITMIKLKYCHE